MAYDIAKTKKRGNRVPSLCSSHPPVNCIRTSNLDELGVSSLRQKNKATQSVSNAARSGSASPTDDASHAHHALSNSIGRSLHLKEKAYTAGFPCFRESPKLRLFPHPFARPPSREVPDAKLVASKLSHLRYT